MKKEKRLVNKGTICVGVIVFPGAEVDRNEKYEDSIPLRIKREIAAANALWQQNESGNTRGVQFKVVKTVIFDQRIKGIDLNVEKISMTNKKLNQNGLLLSGIAKKLLKEADIYVFYMTGETIGPVDFDGSRILALTYIDYPIVIMSNGARTNDFILAHELGHVLFNNNIYGNTSDPDPYKGDPAHNARSSNLMFPTGLYWPPLPKLPKVTSEQIKKALETKFFYD
jgi:hypothetical protein